jgi:hypothetical protein
VIFPARWSEADGRIGGIATGATIAAEAADVLSIGEAGHAQVEVKGLQIGKPEAELVGVPANVSASLLSTRT